MVNECAQPIPLNTSASPATANGPRPLVLPNALGAKLYTSDGLTSPHSPGAGARRQQHAILLAEWNEKWQDWRVQCRKCGQWRTGSLQALRRPCECVNGPQSDPRNPPAS